MTAALTVDRARLWELAVPLSVPFAISGGVMHVRRPLIVELTTADGAICFGESAPLRQIIIVCERLILAGNE